MATITKSLTIKSQGTYNLTFDLWSYSEWAASAGITTSYASLAALIADEKAVRQLMIVHASVDYFATCPDSTIISTVINNDLCAKWINLSDYAFDKLSAKSNIKSVMDTADKYGYGEWGKINSTTWGPLGNVPIMTANNAPYGTAIRSSISIDYYEPFHAFDNSDIQRVWIPTMGATNNYIGYTFVNPVKVKSLHFVARIFGMSNVTFTVQGSNDGFVNDIHDITTFTTQSATTEIRYETDINVDSSDYYLSYRIFSASVIYVNDNSALLVATLQFYGHEEKLVNGMPTPDYSEKEFAQGSTRKTIYDHGVAPSGAITGGTKNPDCLTLSAVGTATVTIDKGTRTYMGGKAGLHASGTNRLICGSGYSAFTSSNMPDSNGFDISSISGSVAVGIKQTASGTFDCTEIWIE